LGVNRLDNVEFVDGGNGVAAGWGSTTYQVNATYQVNPALPTLTPKDLPAGDNVVQLYQSGRNDSIDGYMEVSRSVSGIQAGHRYSFSVYTAVQGATGFAFMYWVDASGKLMSYTSATSASTNAGEAGGGTSLANYKRLVATGVAPEGAVGAIVVIRKGNSVAGAGMSRLLAAHAQFEEVPAAGVDASPWTRPLIARSADDRVTSYVYDALGRQRFSVDALGYVSERSYDAAGNVVEETRYANKLQGPRDSVSLQKLGVNRLDNVEFVDGGNGVAAGWGSTTYQVNATYQVNPALPTLTPKDLPAGDNVVQLYQSGRNDSIDGYMEVSRSVSGIQAGHRYSFSVYTAVQGATGFAFMYWVDASGKLMSYTSATSASTNAGEAGGGTSLADYKRLVATGVAPEGAVGAIVVIRKGNSVAGAGMSRLLAAHAQFEEVPAAGVDASPWTRPLIARSADDRVTSYVYDALGRQRFSVDALGYVTERSYDAAGNVVEEIRYANKLQGPRDSVSLQKLGVNRLDNVEFVDGGNGVAAGWGSTTYQVNATYQVNPALPTLTPKDLPAGDNVVQLYQSGRNDSIDGYMEVSRSVSGIQAGHRYSFSVYTAVQGATGFAFMYWVDASGKLMGYTSATSASMNAGEAGGGTSLADYKRLVATGVAPEGAVGAIVVIRKGNSVAGAGMSRLLAAHAQFEEVPAAGVDASPWTRPLIARSADDRVSHYTYDAVGQLKNVSDPLGYVEAYSYDAFGNRTRLTNKNGQTWNYRYDQAGRLLEEITPTLWLSRMDSNGHGTGQSVSLVTRYGYDAFGSVISRSEGRLRATVDSDPALDDVSQARTSTFGYDALGRQVRIISPGWYDKASGQYQQNADGSANTFQVTTEVTYDALGNAVRNRVRVNNTGVAAHDYVDSYKAYDLLGQVRYEVDALKGVTAYEYDGFGQAVLTRRNALPLNAGVPASGYYQVGDFNASTAPSSPGNDRTIITRYDRLGRKTEVQQDLVSLYAFTGNVATSALKNVAPVKAYSYNAFGQVARETVLARDSAGNSVMEQISTVNYYDRAGQRIGTVDALGYYTRLEYTGSGKVSRQVEYASALTGWSESSIPAAATTGKDRSVRFVYDAADRLVQTVRENATYWQQSFASNPARATMTQVTGDVVVSRSTYDGVGNALTLTDALGNVTTTTYNALGQVVKVTEPARYTARAGAANPFDSAVYASPTTLYEVNAFGQVLFEVHSAGDGQAGLQQFSRSVYDAAGHLIKEFDAAGSAQNFKVDAAGRRLEETREIYSVLTGWRYVSQTLRRTFAYDSLGQQLSTSDWYDNGTRSTTNAVIYNRFGEVTAELLNGNYKASYAYDQLGNATWQTNAQGTTRIDYDLTGKASRSMQLGDLNTATDDRVTYVRNDLLGRVLEQHLPAFEANVNVDTLNNVNLTLTTPIIRQASDRWGNVLTRIDPRGYVTRYTYDHNNQVLTETLPETDILRENGSSYRASLVHEKRYDALGQLTEEADLIGGAVLRSRQHVYNQAGELVRDIDALGASRYYIQDAHGNRVGTYDPLGIVTVDGYDAMDRHTSHGIVRNGQQVTLLTNQYDQAGRLYGEINGSSTVSESLTSTPNADGSSTIAGVMGNTRFTVFDERGNIVQTRNESNIQKTFVFNEANRKVAEIDGLGNSLTWTYNEWDYGRLTARTDLSGQGVSYSYNAFGQLLKEAKPSYFEGQLWGSQDRTYEYYGNGSVKSIRDESVGSIWGDTQWSVATYQYDQAGQRLREYSQSYYKGTMIFWFEASGQTEQRFKFDELGRLKEVKAPAGTEQSGWMVFTALTGRVDALRYDYDELGNRRRAYMDTTNQSGVRTVIDDWYRYDLEGRVLVGKGYQSNGQVLAGKAKGYAVAYDAAGRRLSSEEWSASITGGERYARSTYSYNDMGQVLEARSGLLTRAAGADASAAVLGADPEKVLFRTTYDELGNRSSQMSYTNNVATERTTYRFRGDGQLISQVVAKLSGGAELKTQANYFGEAGMIDAAGNQASYRYVVYGANGVSVSYQGRYVRTFALFDTYKEQNIEVTADIPSQAGWTSTLHDARGNAVSVQTYNGSILNQSFTSNKEGLLTSRTGSDNQHTQSYLYYQGAALANYGNLSAAQITDTLSPISEEYPGRTPGNYVVSQGDTLASIAQAVWGDSKMWYLIADANGIDPAQGLVVGDSIRIPNVVSSTHNDATTFKPYNASDVLGDTTPTPVFPPPPKPKKKKCKGIASVVMVVVAVVATVFTAGAAAFAMTAATGTLTVGGAVGAGMAAVAGGTIAGGFAVGVAAFGIGATVGSLASQAVGKAMGVVDHISWRQAAVAGLGGAIGAGITSIAAGANSTLGSALEAAGKSSATWQQAAIAYGAQGVAGYAGSYVASKVVGLDTSFSWRNMAASAVSSIIAGSINQGSGFWDRTVRGQLSAHSSAWMRDKWFGGDRPDYGQVAADAFGNSLVDYAVGQMRSSVDEKQKNAEVREKYRYAMASTDVDSAQGYMSTDTPNWKGAVDPDLKFLAEVRESGWFSVLSSMADEDYASFSYEGNGSKGAFDLYSDVPKAPEIDPVTGKPLVSVSPERSWRDRYNDFYNDYAVISPVRLNGDLIHDSIAETANFFSLGINGIPLLLGGADELLAWAGFGGIGRLSPVGLAPQTVLKAEASLLKQVGPVLSDVASAVAAFPLLGRSKAAVNIDEKFVFKTYSGSVHAPDFVGPYPRDMGPVWVKAMPDSTQAELDQIHAYIKLSNEAIAAGALSPTGRVSTGGELRRSASMAAAIERRNAIKAGTPYVGHVGHVPDTTWVGRPAPYTWLDLSPRVNLSLGGQAGGYPLGYKPVIFVFDGGVK
ncbi:YD repeat-containing protein, partial [Pseudomonas japonica]